MFYMIMFMIYMIDGINVRLSQVMLEMMQLQLQPWIQKGG